MTSKIIVIGSISQQHTSFIKKYGGSGGYLGCRQEKPLRQGLTGDLSWKNTNLPATGGDLGGNAPESNSNTGVPHSGARRRTNPLHILSATPLDVKTNCTKDIQKFKKNMHYAKSSRSLTCLLIRKHEQVQ